MKAYLENKATLPSEDVQNARWPDNKETVATYNVVAMYKGEFKNPVTLRLFMGRSNNASTVYATIHCNNDKRWISGRGQAGGYGYCKQSAAAESAIESAGIKLAAHIGGVGEGAIREALRAIARSLGYRKFIVLES